MAKDKKIETGGVGEQVNGKTVIKNLGDLANLKENMPDATEPLKNSLAECFENDELVIDSLFSHYSSLRLSSMDRKKLLDRFKERKKDAIDGMVDFFVKKLGIQNVILIMKERGGPMDFIEYYENAVNVLSNREVLGYYKEILEEKKPTKKQQKDLAEIARLNSEVLNLEDVEVVAPGAEKNSGEITSPQAGAPKNMNENIVPKGAEAVDEKTHQRFQRILAEFSNKFSAERVARVERMRKLTGTHIGLAYDIEAIRKQAEAIIAKYRDDGGADKLVAELAMREISEKLKKGDKKQESMKDGHIASFISSEIKRELGDNERAFVEDARELEINERKTREIVSDYAFGKGDSEYEARIDAAIDKIKDSGVKLTLSPNLIKKRYIAQKRYIVNELANSIVNSDENFKKILAMKKGESEPDADLKLSMMREIRQMIVNVFEYKEKPKPVAPEPPENIPVVPEPPAAPEDTSERGLAELEEEIKKFTKDENHFLNDHLRDYNKKLNGFIERKRMDEAGLERFRSNFILSTREWALKRGFVSEKADLLEEYLRAKLKTSIEPEAEEVSAAEPAAAEKSPKAPSTKFEIKSAKEKVIWDIISREVDWFCDIEPDSEYSDYFQKEFDKFEKGKASYRDKGLDYVDADLIGKIFRAERGEVKSRILQYIEAEMRKVGKDYKKATLKEIADLARRGRRKEIDEYFQKAVRGELGTKDIKEMETEIKFSKEEMELLNSLSEVAQEVWEEELEDSKSWGGKWTRERVFDYFKPVLGANMEEILEQRGFDSSKQKAALENILSKVK